MLSASFLVSFLFDAVHQGMAKILKRNQWPDEDILKLTTEVQTITANSEWKDGKHLYRETNNVIWKEIALRCFPERSWIEIRSKYKEINHVVFAFVNKIKQRFGKDQEKKYHMFLDILNKYKQTKAPVKDVIDEVCCRSSCKLLGMRRSMFVHVCVCARMFLRVHVDSYLNSCAFGLAIDNQVSELLRDNHDLLQEFTLFLRNSVEEDAKNRVQNGINRTGKVQHATAYLAKIRQQFANDSRNIYEEFVNVMHKWRLEKGPIEQLLCKV